MAKVKVRSCRCRPCACCRSAACCSFVWPHVASWRSGGQGPGGARCPPAPLARCKPPAAAFTVACGGETTGHLSPPTHMSKPHGTGIPFSMRHSPHPSLHCRSSPRPTRWSGGTACGSAAPSWPAWAPSSRCAEGGGAAAAPAPAPAPSQAAAASAGRGSGSSKISSSSGGGSGGGGGGVRSRAAAAGSGWCFIEAKGSRLAVGLPSLWRSTLLPHYARRSALCREGQHLPMQPADASPPDCFV